MSSRRRFGAGDLGGPELTSSGRIPQRSRVLALYARQLTVLLGAGVPLASSLEILSDQFEEPTARRVFIEVRDKVNGGFSLSNAMACHPQAFSRVFVSLVRTGESTGDLTGCLAKLSLMLEKEDRLKQRLSSAFIYPSFVLGTTLVLTLFLFYTILPNFIQIFREMNVALPLVTRILMLITDSLRNPGCWLMVAGLGLIVTSRLRVTLATSAGQLRLNYILLALPAIGPILLYASLARYCWVMEIVLGSGMDLLTSLPLAAGASGSPILEKDAVAMCDHIREGNEMSEHFRQHPRLYSRVLGSMVAAAEETSDLDRSFQRLATWFQLEMEGRVDFFNALIEPALMGVVAAIVGTVVVGIFLPLYGFLGQLGT